MLLKRWALTTAFLVLATLSYRLSFTIYHQQIFTAQPLLDQLYALLWGLRFDIALAMPMALLSIIVHRIFSLHFTLPWHLYATPWLPFLFVIHTGDTLYFQDAGRHIGYEILAASGDVWELIQHAFHAGFNLIISNLLLLAFWLSVWLKYAGTYFHHHPHETYLKKTILSITLLLLTTIGIRGGITGVPQSPIHVYKIGDSKLAIIASNPVYITISVLTSKSSGIKRVELPISDLDPVEVLHSLYPEQRVSSYKNPVKLNIILIYLESWNAAFMQSYNPNATLNITPHFDQFREASLSSDLTLAGGHRTVEGVFASMCSFQNPLGTSIAQSQLLNLSYLCLPEILNQQGYITSFIQGSYRDTGSVGSFAQRLGFKESLGKVELPKGNLAYNAWGLQDDDLYDIILDKALQQQKAFFFAVNTTSTHDTVLPAHVKPLMQARTSEEKHKNMMHYADEAFGRFLKRFNSSPLAKNTILVAMADHTAQIHSSDLHEYMIPMAIKAPKMTKNNIPYATSQRDIAPTLLDLLQLPIPAGFAGKSLLSANVFFADYYHNQHLGWIEDNLLLNINLLDHSMSCFLWRKDLMLKSPVSCAGQQNAKQRALNVTNQMQDHLFSGSTTDFLRARSKQGK